MLSQHAQWIWSDNKFKVETSNTNNPLKLRWVEEPIHMQHILFVSNLSQIGVGGVHKTKK